MFWAHRSWNNLQCILMKHLCTKICRVHVALGHLLQNTSLLQRLQDNHVTLWSSSSHCPLKDAQVILHIIVLKDNPRILGLKENKSFTKHRKQDMLASRLFTGSWLSMLALTTSVLSARVLPAARAVAALPFPSPPASAYTQAPAHTEIEIIATRGRSLAPDDSAPVPVIWVGFCTDRDKPAPSRYLQPLSQVWPFCTATGFACWIGSDKLQTVPCGFEGCLKPKGSRWDHSSNFRWCHFDFFCERWELQLAWGWQEPSSLEINTKDLPFCPAVVTKGSNFFHSV